MSVKNTKAQSRTDFKRLSRLPDNEIDFSDIPALDKKFFEKAVIQMPVPKSALSLRLDRDILEWFKKPGRGYQTRINAVLRTYMAAKSH
jgi:uncharacterized protein (DUF4415 family)